jgi:hypothetical protein
MYMPADVRLVRPASAGSNVPVVAVKLVRRRDNQMAGEPEQLDSTIPGWVGRKLKRIARILYEHRRHVNRVDGALELHFDDGSVVLLDALGNGDCLRVRSQRWIDPFGEPLSDENEHYVESHGKWKWVDDSSETAYAAMIENTVSSVSLLANEFGSIAGVRISTTDAALWFFVAGDECHVAWAHPIGFREVIGYDEDGNNVDT